MFLSAFYLLDFVPFPLLAVSLRGGKIVLFIILDKRKLILYTLNETDNHSHLGEKRVCEEDVKGNKIGGGTMNNLEIVDTK